MIGWLHERLVHRRRIGRLSEALATLIPENARVADIGCGDGEVARAIGERRPDLDFLGLEVRARPTTAIPVIEFDGTRIPLEDDAVDIALLIDVVHHARDPDALLQEACRVARFGLVIKDHLLGGLLAGPTLRFMDRIGNARHGVDLPYNYWPEPRWRDAFARLGLTLDRWENRIGLYPFPASLVFDRTLHFVARARPGGRA